MSHIFLVCLDSPSSGRFFSQQLNGEVYFSTLADFLMMADSHCNRLASPQSGVRIRTFGNLAGDTDDLFEEEETPEGFNAITLGSKGEMATFLVTVHHRQHGTWQGTVQWLEGKQEEYFRSAFELTCIIYSTVLMGIDWNTQTSTDVI